jgi:uncharacterized repeat protein (TIGR01451 family)
MCINHLHHTKKEERIMRKLYFVFTLLLLTAIAVPTQVMAAGTLAGTAISNQSYADYKDANGNTMTRVFSNTVTTTVSQVAGATILPPTNSQSAKNGDVIYYVSQLFNTGNAADTQTINISTSGTWTPTTVRIWWDKDSSHTYDAGDVLLSQVGPNTFKTVDAAGSPMNIVPDDDYDLLIEVTVPVGAPAVDNSSSVITLTTKSDFDNTKTAIGTYTTTVQAAVISAFITHTPVGAPTHLKPGEAITYTITLTNSGSTAGTNMVLNDPLPNGVTFVPGSLKSGSSAGNLTTQTDAADNDGLKYDAGTRTVIAPDGSSALSLAGGATLVVQFQAAVNAGVPSSTVINNQASLAYSSGANNVSVQSNGDFFVVATLAAIQLSSSAAPQSGNPGDRIVYPFTVANNGNASDNINLTYVSTQGWSWAIWADNNGDGIPGNAGDFLLTDTNADGKIDTGALTQNGIIKLLAVATVPVGAANGTTDLLTLTGESITDPTKTASQAFTTTTKAPVLSVVKGLTAVQAPNGGAVCIPTNTTTGSPCQVFPGSVLTYTITATNSGNGNASTVALTDLTPQYTIYKQGTIKTGSSQTTLTPRSDTQDGDGAEYNSGTHAVVVPDGGTLPLGPTGTWVLQYQLMVN